MLVARRLGAFLLAFSVLACAPAAMAQRIYRLAALVQGSPPPPGSLSAGPITTALRQYGYIEGENLIVDRRFAEGNTDRFARLAAEIVALKPDVIIAESTPAIFA